PNRPASPRPPARIASHRGLAVCRPPLVLAYSCEALARCGRRTRRPAGRRAARGPCTAIQGLSMRLIDFAAATVLLATAPAALAGVCDAPFLRDGGHMRVAGTGAIRLDASLDFSD